jgi:hypothetical protein
LDARSIVAVERLSFQRPGGAPQTNSPPSTTATRPARTPPDQTSVPNNAPAATTTQTTGESGRDPTIKKMNENEKQKVDTKGK